jgi:hypothetical protein
MIWDTQFMTTERNNSENNMDTFKLANRIVFLNRLAHGSWTDARVFRADNGEVRIYPNTVKRIIGRRLTREVPSTHYMIVRRDGTITGEGAGNATARLQSGIQLLVEICTEMRTLSSALASIEGNRGAFDGVDVDGIVADYQNRVRAMRARLDRCKRNLEL